MSIGEDKVHEGGSETGTLKAVGWCLGERQRSSISLG